jgi:hypothetical protein
MTFATKQLAWRGASGRQYTFDMYRAGNPAPTGAGIYMFCYLNSGYYYSAYAGQSSDLYNRVYTNLSAHQAWNCALNRGCQYVPILRYNGTEAQRLAIETDLRNGLKPPCNKQ